MRNRVLMSLLASLACFSLLIQNVGAPPGDMDRDYDVDIDDLYLVLIWYDNEVPPERPDWDRDGLIDLDDLFYVLLFYAPNWDFGYIEGFILDADTLAPIEGAFVSSPTGGAFFADSEGFYSLEVWVGTYDVTAESISYMSQTTFGVAVAPMTTVTVDFFLEPIP